jgi:endonuclease/exonuclease/phosphatase family metal-dependent hydrolase
VIVEVGNGVVQFRLLTYNIHKAIGVDRKFAPERIVEVLGHHDADIVLLQEVDRGAPRSNHIDLASYLARQLGYRYHAAGMNVFLRKGKYGNATLSRFPIGRQRNIDLTVSWRKRRGAQHTRIRIPRDDARGGPVELDVFNVHLGLSAMERRQQMRTLMRTSDIRALGASNICIVAGDTNDWRNVLRRPFFTRRGFDCATNRRLGSNSSIKTFPSYAPAGGLDKIFYRGPIHLIRTHRSRLALARVASDHLPVMAEFEI